MHNIGRLLAAAALAALSSTAGAQEPASVVVNGTTITVGGGAQLLSLPDIDFTFLVDDSGAAFRTQRNSDLDDYGGVFVGGVETPLGHWGSTPVTGVVSGFFANVEDTERKRCNSSSDAGCFAENIVDNPNRGDSFGYGQLTTNTNRDVDFWGVGAEARFGKAPAPMPDRGGYLFRLAYVGIGGDVRGIDQDNRLRLRGDGPDINYTETRPMPAPSCRPAANTTSSVFWALADRWVSARCCLCVAASTTPMPTTPAASGCRGRRRGSASTTIGWPLSAPRARDAQAVRPAHQPVPGLRLRVVFLCAADEVRQRRPRRL